MQANLTARRQLTAAVNRATNNGNQMETKTYGELQNLFKFQDGTDVRTQEDWARRREELRSIIVDIEYGGFPPRPSGVTGQKLHVQQNIARLEGATFRQYRIIDNDRPSFYFFLDVFTPPGKGPFPVILTGDGCWRYVSDEIICSIMRRGFALAQFNRTAIVPDTYTTDRDTGLYLAYPDQTFGALSAWAWGYHRCIDFLVTQDYVDPAAIAAVGHSRGGKTALLAGATDERIAVTAPNDSGCAGAGCHRWQGPKCETIADMQKSISYWLGPKFWQYAGNEQNLPFDQHFLKALVAPRALLSTEALGDLWANPSGTWQTHLAAREAYRFLGVESRIATWFREGQHSHSPADWAAFLDFTSWQLKGAEPTHKFNVNPFPEMQPCFSWSAPPQKMGPMV